MAGMTANATVANATAAATAGTCLDRKADDPATA
jgi:hypothetical protein